VSQNTVVDADKDAVVNTKRAVVVSCICSTIFLLNCLIINISVCRM